VGRNNVLTTLQRLSNSIHAADAVIRKSDKLHGHEGRQRCLLDLKDANEALRGQVLDPLVAERKLDSAHSRQIEGALSKVRDAIITLEVEVISKLE
jgi:hypothetical protein